LYIGGYPYEQQCVYQSEEFKLRRFEKSGREIGGLMLNITGLKSLLKSHLIISTCKMQGVSVLDYFKRFFSEIVKGRKGYEHLLPLTIGVN
jgi:hypothetical protein